MREPTAPAYHDRRAPEYDELVSRPRPLRRRDRPGFADELRHVTDTLEDGTGWEVDKRWFTADSLLTELGGGDVLHAGHWFVVVRTPR